ncbi:MAG: GNAT family N-acetyltransferase, partial [Aureispira sp.]|nr:GNAT family N-acetyltransferase [Aureispira sp.]
GALYLYQIADNQKDVKKHLLKENLAFDFKSQFPVDPTTIKSVIERQKIMIDGQSPSRLLTFFRSLEQEASLSIEKATDQHLMQYFDWANDPSVRQNAFNSDSIPLENHTKWFSKKIVENNALLLYFHDNNKPIGQVRLELNENNHAQIDYSVDSKQHSKGYGTTILKLALLYAVEHQFCSKFFGDVKSTNIASRKIFQKLAFAESFNTEKDYYTYELEIPAHA